jgi:pyruvate-ferredoxin/flavodoxin oxidoreductase
VKEILTASQRDESEIQAQRARVEELRGQLPEINGAEAQRLGAVLESLVEKSVWVVGGDGWAYDIGFGGLDHLLASGRNVNVLLLDTEVYSNTGGQMSKATPRAAVAKFAAGGKGTPKKDIGMIAMAHSHAYVAQVAMGANDRHTLRAFLEAERHPGPSLIIAYSHCVAHGIDMARGMEHQKLAVDCGHWPLYRYDPERTRSGHSPLQLDSRKPRVPFRQFAAQEARFQILLRSQPAEAQRLLELAQQDVDERWNLLSQMAEMHYEPEEGS